MRGHKPKPNVRENTSSSVRKPVIKYRSWLRDRKSTEDNAREERNPTKLARKARRAKVDWQAPGKPIARQMSESGNTAAC
jgi:hypothetical protein